MSDGVLAWHVPGWNAWLFNGSPQSSVCLFHMIKHNIFVKVSLNNSQLQKHLSTWAVWAAHSYWVSGCEMQQWGCQKDTSEPVLPVQGPGLICNTNKTSCCRHCQAGAALWAPLPWREGLLRAPVVHSSHWQHHPGSYLQTTKPLPFPDRSLHPSTGELVFLVWGGNATHPSVSNLVQGVCCQM